MISTLEIRHIIESAFLPMACRCTISPGGSLTVHVTDPATGRADLVVTGIAIATLSSARAISDLVAELRTELRVNQQRLSPANEIGRLSGR